MGRRALKYKHKPVFLKKACVSPDFLTPTVLVSHPWDHVDLWLRRRKHDEARFYWEQAREFSEAARVLPPTAAPLPAYYCLLNATKALLVAKRLPFRKHHGVVGWKVDDKRGLRAEKVEFKGGGVLPALVDYLGETAGPGETSLYELLYNLPYIHRAFTLTYKTAKELFIPVRNSRFVVKDGSNDAWFEAQITGGSATGHTTAKLPPGYERDVGVDGFVIRRKKRFTWTFTKAAEETNLEALRDYHHGIRRQLMYINGSSRLWYIKRKADGVADWLDRSSLTITFAAMHRLSELARYEPLQLAKHFEASHNWLVTEFIEVALRQFTDEIASELTGREFMSPGIRT